VFVFTDYQCAYSVMSFAELGTVGKYFVYERLVKSKSSGGIASDPKFE